MKKLPPSSLALPFAIVRDDREGAPFHFQDFVSDAKDGNRPLFVNTIVRRLLTGDYSIAGLESRVAIERKSLEDLYGTLADAERRYRFESEHQRMRDIMSGGGFCCVVIEASLEDAMTSPPSHSRLNPKSVFRTWLSWAPRYCVPWQWCGSRRIAEAVTLRTLEKVYRHLTEPPKLPSEKKGLSREHGSPAPGTSGSRLQARLPF